MTVFSELRRNLLGKGVCALAAAAALPSASQAGISSAPGVTNEALVRKYYGGWVKKDWPLVNSMLADDFTFTSAAPDDHISKAAFKKQCWDTQSALIEAFDLERLLAGENEAFVKYLCHTKSGKSFRNVEYLRFRDSQLIAIECYFGGPGYPSAANTRNT
jgi:ketosteroid isomerase-like protein